MSELQTIDTVTSAKLLARNLTPASEFNKIGKWKKFRGLVLDVSEKYDVHIGPGNRTQFYAVSVRDSNQNILQVMINSAMQPTNELRERGVCKKDYIEFNYYPCTPDDIHVRNGLPALPRTDEINIVVPAELITAEEDKQVYQGIVKDVEQLSSHQRWDFNRLITLEDASGNSAVFVYYSDIGLPHVNRGDHAVLAAKGKIVAAVKSYPA